MSHVVASVVVVSAATSAVSHVATSATAVVSVVRTAHVVGSASLVSSANVKEIVHNKNAPIRRKENFFIFFENKI